MLSGRRLDLIDPSPLDVEIGDIAHGLARVARWNGQTKGPEIFSVAQHSLLVEALFAAGRARSFRQGAAHGVAARRARICDRRHDLAVQGGDRRRLQADRGAPKAGDPHSVRPPRRAARRPQPPDQDCRPGLGLSRGDRARRLLDLRKGASSLARPTCRSAISPPTSSRCVPPPSKPASSPGSPNSTPRPPGPI